MCHPLSYHQPEREVVSLYFTNKEIKSWKIILLKRAQPVNSRFRARNWVSLSLSHTFFCYNVPSPERSLPHVLDSRH